MNTKRSVLILALATMLSLSACVMSPPPAEPPASTQAPAAGQTPTAAPTVAASPNQATWDGVLSQWIAAQQSSSATHRAAFCWWIHPRAAI